MPPSSLRRQSSSAGFREFPPKGKAAEYLRVDTITPESTLRSMIILLPCSSVYIVLYQRRLGVNLLFEILIGCHSW